MDSSEAGLYAVGKNQDQAGLAAQFRTERPDIPTITTVYAEEISLEEFQSTYVSNNLPIVIKNALTNKWKCMEAWNAEYLKQTVGSTELLVRVNPDEDGTFGDVGRLDERQVSLYDFESLCFAEFLDHLSVHPPKFYPARVEMCNDLPELVPDVPSFYDIPWRFAFGCPYKNGPTAYFGPGNQTTPLHYDTLENITFMITGNKTFTLYPPCESPLMKPSPRSLGTHYSLMSSKAYAECPALCFEVTLERGDMLYLPNCWWHRVHGGDGFNISLNYWFCQNKSKEDYDAYGSYLTASYERTLAQLRSMNLPESVLEEAEKDAGTTIDAKLNQRKLFDWNTPV